MESTDTFMLGAAVTLSIMTIVWLSTGHPKQTIDGRYYIKAHGKAYELKSPNPVKLSEHLFIVDEEKNKKKD